MKKFLTPLFFTAPVLLVACSTTSNTQTSPKPIGMANPASVYCTKIGGTSILKKDAQGNDVGYCQLPNGQITEEWQLFRDAHKQ